MPLQKKLKDSKIITENQWLNGNQVLSKIKPASFFAERKSLMDTNK